MSRFFSYFPKAVYTLNDGNNINLVTNILRRMKFEDSLKNDTVVYYEYTIQDGDRPETIAHKFYGDIEKHWMVLLLNDIVDVYSQWPLDYEAFKKMLIQVYGSVATAMSTVHQRQKIVTYTDTTLGISRTEVMVIDEDTYTTLPVEPSTVYYTLGNGVSVSVTTERKSISKYDYETALNNAKRNIKLLKPELVDDVMSEFIDMMEENV